MTADAGLPRHLSASDSVAWRIERNPRLRSTITMVMLLDRAPNHRALRATVDAASVTFPRLRQRVVEVPLRASTAIWQNDPDFDPDYHMRTVSAGPDRSLRALLDLAAAIGMQAFDPTRPPWEWVTVDGLEGGRAAVIIKIHHAVTDGVGGMRLMSQLFDLERHDAVMRTVDPDAVPQGEMTQSLPLLAESVAHQAECVAARARRMAGGVLGAARHPLGGARDAAKGLSSTARLLRPARGPMSPLMTNRSSRLHFETFDVPLADLKAAARRTQGKLNDAFLAASAIGLRLYHETHGQRAEALRVNMPINLRTDESLVGGNNWVPARFPVPLGGRDVDRHMREIHDLVARQRAEPSLDFVPVLAATLDRLPTAQLTQVFTGLLACLDFAATNVPGVPFPLYLAGAEVQAMLAFAPPAGAAINVGLLSYRDTAHIALNMDPVAIPDPAVMLDCMREGFARVIDPHATRPSPDGHRRRSTPRRRAAATRP